MNSIITTPDVRLFVVAVREHLADLTAEEREELTGGLEGDMSDLVEERGVDSLPEPAEYAAELRSAAGFSPVAPAGTRSTRPFQDRADRLLDAGRDRWEGFASGLPGQPWELLVTLRPVWWVLRAWVALQTVDLFWGSGGYNYGLAPVPSLRGGGLVLLVVAAVLSVQMGRGRLWPATPGSGVVARLLLLTLNVFALAMTPVTFGSLLTPAKAEMWFGSGSPSSSASPPGLSFNGNPVANVYPYDAQGHPLTGVQLVDRQGRRLSVTNDPYDEESGWGEFVLAPWLNGNSELYSVFPLPEQTLDPDTLDPLGEPRLQAPPFASLPPVTSPGIQPTVVAPATSPAPRAERRAAAEKATP